MAKNGRLAKLYLDVLSDVGALAEEPAYMDLANTPGRVQRMMRDELLSSYKVGALTALLRTFTTFPVSPSGMNAMVVEVGIPFYSLCGHHMLPFFGTACVGYVPRERIVGLSKIPRVIDFFSRKLQVQERLVDEVADFLVEQLNPLAVIVLMEARHLCMEARGVRKAGVTTRTTALRGSALTDGDVRREFYAMIG